MSNHGTFPRSTGCPAKNEAAMYRWMGWDDYANERPFLEIVQETNFQRAYERGRLLAAVAKCHLGFVPRWKKTALFDSITKKYPQITQAIREEHRFTMI